MTTRTRFVHLLTGFLLLACTGFLYPAKYRAETARAKSSSCDSPAYRQFDFWVGDWDAYDFGGSAIVARVRVQRTLDGCALLEDYQDTGGQHGQSFSIYDASRKVWHQTWVTNRGRLLVIEGSFSDGEMVLSGNETTGTGGTVVRGTWKPIEGGVRETGVASQDGGKTWQPWFDLVFRPHHERTKDQKHTTH